MGDGYSIKHRDEFETMEGSGERDLAAGAQGARHRRASATTWSRSPPAARSPSTTTASSGEVEVYVILEGEAIMRLDGEDHPAPAGTFASIERPDQPHDPQPLRGAGHRAPDRRPPEGGYEPMSWG